MTREAVRLDIRSGMRMRKSWPMRHHQHRTLRLQAPVMIVFGSVESDKV
jgi:hypothetical protein